MTSPRFQELTRPNPSTEVNRFAHLPLYDVPKGRIESVQARLSHPARKVTGWRYQDENKQRTQANFEHW